MTLLGYPGPCTVLCHTAIRAELCWPCCCSLHPCPPDRTPHSELLVSCYYASTLKFTTKLNKLPYVGERRRECSERLCSAVLHTCH
jgi:hypothetical protein